MLLLCFEWIVLSFVFGWVGLLLLLHFGRIVCFFEGKLPEISDLVGRSLTPCLCARLAVDLFLVGLRVLAICFSTCVLACLCACLFVSLLWREFVERLGWGWFD